MCGLTVGCASLCRVLMTMLLLVLMTMLLLVDVQMLHASGEVGARTLIWTKGMKNWARLEKLPELVARIAEPCVSPKHTDEVEEEEAPRRTADSDVVTSGRDDDVDVVFESRFATEPGVQWDRTPGSMRSNDDDAHDVHVQGEEEDEEEEEQEEEEEEEEQVHEDALDNEETFREESHEVSLLREKVTQLELELASVNAESIHMRDMMEARRERQQEQEKVRFPELVLCTSMRCRSVCV